MDLNKWAEEIHAIAKSKGWWAEDTERTRDDIIALCHSELSEALECYRDGHAVDEIWHDGDKPEGVPVELADCVIRILDYAGREGWRMHEWVAWLRTPPVMPLPVLICRSHLNLSLGWQDSHYQHQCMVAAVGRIAGYLQSIGVDIEEVMRLKCSYNRTRSHRHGGKVL